jgi:hypothetical protein
MTKIKSSRSRLAIKSRRPRPLNASIFVARKYGAVTTRISKSRNSRCMVAASIAARYQRLENPRIFSSRGMTSRIACIGTDFSYRVHIRRGARQTRALIRHEQACDGSSHKYEVPQHRTQQRGDRNKPLKVWIGHGPLATGGVTQSRQSYALEPARHGVHRRALVAHRMTRHAAPPLAPSYTKVQAKHRVACLPDTARRELDRQSWR